MKKGKKKKQEEFDYSSFEKLAIARLRQGDDLVGSHGVLKEIIQRIVSSALEGELTHHLAEEKKKTIPSNKEEVNRRNGKKTKKINTSLGQIPIERSRDRNGTFEPVLIKRWDRNLNTGLDAQIIELYTRGNSVDDIRSFIEKMYGASLSSGQITAVTDQVWEKVQQWKSRVLKPFYALIYLDAIHFKIRENGKVITKAIYTVYGVDAQGNRDILDIHIGQGGGEGAKEWGRLLEKIKARGVEDVLFFAVDGLTGFSNAILEVYPESIVQRCIVHMIRTSWKGVADKDSRQLTKDLKTIYTADDDDAGQLALDKFAQKWDDKYPHVAEKWRANWLELTAFFGFNLAIRKLIYTTNAVEGLHRKMRKVTKTKGAFVNEKALLKLLWLNLIPDPKSWKKKVGSWSIISSGLTREFGPRFTKHLFDDTINMEKV